MGRRGRAGYYAWLEFNSPMTDETADRLVASLAADAPTRILDIGCGWGELLLRLLDACPRATAHGIDHDDALIERASSNATARRLRDRVTFSSQLADAKPADLVLVVGAEHAIGTFDEALTELATLVEPGGRLLLGTGFWEGAPSNAQVEMFGPLPRLDELVAGTAAAGWRPLDLQVATAADWDRFEFGYLRDWEQAVMAGTDVEAADEARSAADAHRGEYFARRGVLGFAYLTLGRPIERVG
ncbi:MAG: methyltransferase [Actinomycetota bacterium]